MIRPITVVASLVVFASVTAPGANAQSFTGCGGNQFFSCVSLAVTQNTTQLLFTVKNISNGSPANNLLSDFTLIGVGSSGTGPLSMSSSSLVFSTACTTALTGCTKSSSSYANDFQGQGFLKGQNFYGLDIKGNNGLLDGQSASFFLTFTDASGATSFLNGLQLAIHDQGGPIENCSSKVVFNSDGKPTSASSSPTGCNGPPSTVPEPSSLALLGTGLIGLVPMVRKRRK